MKKLLFLLLFPLFTYAQLPIHTGLRRFVVPGAADTSGIAIDTTYEGIIFKNLMNVSYDILRPNKQVFIISSAGFNMNNVPLGQGGKVQFTIGIGSPNILLNGQTNFTVPVSAGVYIFRYSNISNVLNWNYP